MKKEGKQHITPESDGQASSRKEDHITMAFQSASGANEVDPRFSYEPMLSGHATKGIDLSRKVCGLTMNYPIWISSMTGGTEKARIINNNLAKLAGEYGLGMGLGSCRQLLYEDRRLSEFDVKKLMPDSPLLINLGIAQIEELIDKKDTALIKSLIDKLSADGLIIHINPLQEWLQPEGDRIKGAPIELVAQILEEADYPIIVKEVGQGFGRASLEALLALPLEAVDLAGFGGTNFSKLELLRSDEIRQQSFGGVLRVGHTCEEMIDLINEVRTSNPSAIQCKQIIISGGVKGFLDGYYHMQRCHMSNLYAQASGFLRHAMDYSELKKYLELEIEGLKMAHALLRVKENKK